MQSPKRGVKCRAGNTWTESRYFQFIRTALRGAFSRYPVKYQVLKDSQRRVTGQRHKVEHQCAECQEWFKAKEVQVDHIKPAGSLKCYDDLPSFVSNLFCESDNLQVLCKQCHKAKTAEERKKK
jgi:5-methylcytosine-specific restriction endonuclease McrA